MKKYKLLSGEIKEVSPEEEEQFLLDNEGATPVIEDPIDTKETIPPPTTQPITTKTENPIWTLSGQYDTLKQKYQIEGQTDDEFLQSIKPVSVWRERKFWFDKEEFTYSGASEHDEDCLLYTSPSPRDRTRSRMPSSA